MALLEILKIDFVSWWGQNSVHLTMLKKTSQSGGGNKLFNH